MAKLHTRITNLSSSIARGISKISSQTNRAFRSFSGRQHVIFLILSFISVISIIGILNMVNKDLSVRVPTSGGSLSEGIVGTPRFVNPVLAESDADRDLTAIVFSGLMRKMPDGSLVPDLAERYEVSEDSLTYTFFIRPKAYFHDRKAVTADDVMETISRIQDPIIKSPRRANWEGITVKKIDDKTVSFELKRPYAPFLNLTTLGILPAHVWKNISAKEFVFSEYNISPIGSGPFEIQRIKKRASGSPDTYFLKRFTRFTLGVPYLNQLVFRFYGNENDRQIAFSNGDFTQMGAVSPEKALMLSENNRIKTASLPRVFSLFFNQNQNVIFTDKKMIEALDVAVNRDKIIKRVLYDYGVPASDPIPPSATPEISKGDINKAKELLTADGWSLGEDGILAKKFGKETKRLSFSISTGDVPELRFAAQLIKEDLSALGAEIDIKVFDINQLNQDIIRPRRYDALFFGQIIETDADLYAFWHSSQRNDPGLNIAMYANSKVDRYLETAIRTTDTTERQGLSKSFIEEINKDHPAIFVYCPDYIYIVDKNLGDAELGNLTTGSDRFADIYYWYVNSNRVWKIFRNY